MKRSVLYLPAAGLLWLAGSSIGISVSTAEPLLPVQLGMSASAIERDQALVLAGQLRAAIKTPAKGAIQVTLRHRPLQTEDSAVSAGTTLATPARAEQSARPAPKRVKTKRLKRAKLAKRRAAARANKSKPKETKGIDLSRQLLDDAAALAPGKAGAKGLGAHGQLKGGGHRLHAKPGSIKGKAGPGKSAPGTGAAQSQDKGRWSSPGGPGGESAVQPKNRGRKNR